MDFHLDVTNFVGGFSTLVNGLFVITVLITPPDNLGLFRSQYYVGAFASFFFAATQLWTANMWYADGTMFVFFSSRATGLIGFLTFSAAATLQFTMLSSNFVVRYAAVRGGWMRDYLTNHILFYGLQISYVLGGYIPPIYLLSPTPELRAKAQATCSESFEFDFINEFYFISSYEHPTMGSFFIHNSIFLMIVLFQGTNLMIMLVAGLITYFYISKNTQSKKLQEVNNRLLRARVFQGLFTFMFLFMPGMLINSSMILRFNASKIAPLLSSMMSFATLFNPLFDIIMTPGYRKKITRALFYGNRQRQVGDITASTGHTHITHNSAPAIVINEGHTMGNTSSQAIGRDEIDKIAEETEFNRSQIVRLHSRFRTLDKKGQGFLDKEDLLNVPELAVNPLGDRIVDAFFTIAGDETESDRTFLTFRQFVRVLAFFQPIDRSKTNAHNGRKDKLKFAFIMYDLNKNGYITRAEFKVILNSMVGANITTDQLEKIVDRTISEADIDRDGRISFEEFCKAMEKTDIEEKMSIRFLN